MSAGTSKPLERQGSLDDVGACLVGIVRISSANGDMPEEEARAVYSLACLALAEWRKLDAESDGPQLGR